MLPHYGRLVLASPGDRDNRQATFRQARLPNKPYVIDLRHEAVGHNEFEVMIRGPCLFAIIACGFEQ